MGIRMTLCAATALLSLGVVACSTEGPVEGHAPAAIANVPNFDADIGRFLRDYVGEDDSLADDSLDYVVDQGRVRVRGSVDNENERERLSRRIRAVPGVRDVDVREIAIGPK